MPKERSYKIKPSAEYRFFLYDPEGDGMIFFKSEAERDEHIKKCIRGYMSDSDGWSDEVESVCAGEVTHIIKKTNIVPRPSDEEIDEDGVDGEGNWWDTDWLEMCNYELEEISA
jgi:hypothetical protein